MEAKLNAMRQHNELQQELLQHVLQCSNSIENLSTTDSNLELALVGTGAAQGSLVSWEYQHNSQLGAKFIHVITVSGHVQSITYSHLSV